MFPEDRQINCPVGSLLYFFSAPLQSVTTVSDLGYHWLGYSSSALQRRGAWRWVACFATRKITGRRRRTPKAGKNKER